MAEISSFSDKRDKSPPTCELTSISVAFNDDPTSPQTTMTKKNNSHQNRQRQRTLSNSKAYEGSTIVFKDVGVVLSKKEILKNISGMATVGQILAIMGPSGAGKSTLLNTLAGRIPATSGSITLNDEPVTRHIRRKISYVLQQDVFFANLTLRETLTFTTLLRLPDVMPYDLKIQRMHEIVDVLELNKCLDTKIGSTFVTGLSGGEKKRASIACELLTNPKLLMLDEPTSGLDSAIAYSLMSTLAKYSMKSNKTILTTIHQPSSQIFHMFSTVLLLTDGQVAYYGPGKKIIDFFSRLGLHCDPLYNPADFILEQVKSDPETVQRIIEGAYALRSEADWPKQLRDKVLRDNPNKNDQVDAELAKEDTISPNVIKKDDVVQEEIGFGGIDNYAFTNKNLTLDGYEMNDIEKRHSPIHLHHQQQHQHDRHEEAMHEVDVESYIDDDVKFQTGFLTQYKVLTRRAFLQSRTRFLSPLNLCHVFIMILAGLEWFQLRREEETAYDRFGILFFLIVNQGFAPLMDSIFRIFDGDGVFHRERSSGIYRLSAFYLSIMTSDIPFTFIQTTMYVLIVYWMAGLMPAAANFCAFWLILATAAYVAQSFGFFIGVLITNKDFIIPIGNMFMIAFLLMGGFYNSHLAPWFVWARYLSYITYALSALGKVEYMYGEPFTCNPPNITAFPEYCTTGTTFPGVAFLDLKNLNYGPIYLDILVLIGLIFALRIVTYILLRYFRRPKT